MTILTLIHAIINMFAGFGATHTVHGHSGGNGFVFSKHWLVAVCKIPAHLHGTFHCTGSVYK